MRGLWLVCVLYSLALVQVVVPVHSPNSGALFGNNQCYAGDLSLLARGDYNLVVIRETDLDTKDNQTFYISSSTVHRWCGGYCDRVETLWNWNAWVPGEASTTIDFAGTDKHTVINPGAFSALSNVKLITLQNMGIQDLKVGVFRGHFIYLSHKYTA